MPKLRVTKITVYGLAQLPYDISTQRG